MTDHRYDSYCGIYCGACEIVHEERNGRLEEFAKRADKPPDLVACHGCKSEVITKCCEECRIRACAMAKGFETCIECDKCPCELFEFFKQADFYPLYVLMMNNLRTIKEGGPDAWLKGQEKRWSCPECGEASWWYQKTCEDCGAKLYSPEAEASDLGKTQ